MSAADFAGLDADYMAIIDAWTAELHAVMPAIEAWWNALARRLNANGENVANLHWPAGLVAHPRILAIYRKYYFRVHGLNLERYAQQTQGDDEDDESNWGEDGDEEGASGPVPPNLLLVEMMSEYDTELFKHFKYFVYVPIGEDPSLEIC
ncbi:MAG: hypothetical protein E5V89_17845 [Mesorhizobium sp.]|uniref:hypothetical protein n=1 Tax=Mesorhizobium sp. TaxID=1871066 RepID=UPI000FE8B619|nr:hypothetical protein [Mesorhizobium sp.]RWD60248.1 MAG: hypothetical protein EOS36_21815 [Mesorhizobium sp.]TIV69670.1 MAG: hypothetical protein E5V89_17845 [Mesorhizobium sp.]